MNRMKLTQKSMQFLWSLSKKNTQPLQKKTKQYANTHADFYLAKLPDPQAGTIILFHGLNLLGNQDPRIIKLAGALNQIGFHCLVPQLNPFMQFRIPNDKEVNEIGDCLHHFLLQEQDRDKTISFIGPSTSCLYMGKLNTYTELRNKIKSMCFISPYFSPAQSFKEVVETPKSFYAQILFLKMLIEGRYLKEKNLRDLKDLQLLEQAIPLVDSLKAELYTKEYLLNYCSKESALPQLLATIGTTGFITDEMKPFFIELAEKADYAQHITQCTSKISIIHSQNDSIFLPWNSLSLSHHLNKHHVTNQLLITTLLDHADINFKSLVREALPILNAFNAFFKYTRNCH